MKKKGTTNTTKDRSKLDTRQKAQSIKKNQLAKRKGVAKPNIKRVKTNATFPKGIMVYADRSDKAYLKRLLHLIKNAEKTAINEEKIFKETIYHKCIEINFTGLACVTLLQDFEQNGGRLSKERAAVRKAFKDLLSKDKLNKLNKRGIYVRIRFAFNYLYSDYPICLVKAEQEDNWHHLNIAKDADENTIPDKNGNPKMEAIYDYYISEPIHEGEFTGSNIVIAQRASLREIVKLCTRADVPLALGRVDRAINTIQVRFPVIPSPVCTLIINGHTAIADPYLYAKGESKCLNVDFPVTVLESGTKQFNSILQNFYYLWRHDLTIFSKDGSFIGHPDFKGPRDPQGISGLVKARQPFDEKANCQITWAQKEERIEDRRANANKYDHEAFTQEDTPDHKKAWRANLVKKLKMCTRKIDELNADKKTDLVSESMPVTEPLAIATLSSGTYKPDIVGAANPPETKTIKKFEVGFEGEGKGNRKYYFKIEIEGHDPIVGKNVPLKYCFAYLFYTAFITKRYENRSKDKEQFVFGNGKVQNKNRVRSQSVLYVNRWAKKNLISIKDWFVGDSIWLNLNADVISLIGEENFHQLAGDDLTDAEKDLLHGFKDKVLGFFEPSEQNKSL